MLKPIFSVFLFVAFGLMLASSPAFGLKCDETEPAFTRWALVQTLRHDGFPDRMLNEYVELIRVGNIKVNESTCFTLYVYDVEFHHGTRQTTRLLVLKNSSYVGMYPIDDVDLPIGIFGNMLIFPDTGKNTNRIVFDRDEPPEEIDVDGTTKTIMRTGAK
jgi:hypothetical protein